MTSTEAGSPADQRGDSEYFEGWIRLTEDTGEAEFRIGRLRKVAAALIQYRPETARKVARLHDHKGCLSVIWNDRTHAREPELAATAWEWITGEPASNTEHFEPKWFAGAGSEKEPPL